LNFVFEVQIQSIKVDNSGVKVRSMALSPNEDLLVFTLENQQLISLPFQSIDMFKPNDVPKDLNIQVRIAYSHPETISCPSSVSHPQLLCDYFLL
jgi:hypothetical protein